MKICSAIFLLELFQTKRMLNKRVSILLNAEMTSAIKKLISTREGCEINPDDPYVFANGNLGFIDAWHAMLSIAKRGRLCTAPTDNIESHEKVLGDGLSSENRFWFNEGDCVIPH